MPHAIEEDVFEPNVQARVFLQYLLEDVQERLARRIRHQLVVPPAQIQNLLPAQPLSRDGFKAVERGFAGRRVGARGIEAAWEEQTGGIELCDCGLQRWREVGGPQEVGARRGAVGVGCQLGQARAVRHQARVVRTANPDDAGGDARVREQAVPCGVPAETDAQRKVICDSGWGRRGVVENVGFQVRNEMRAVD